MKIVLIIVLVLVAIGSFVLGMIAGADPEGRGSNITLGSWAVALMAIIGAVAAGIWV